MDKRLIFICLLLLTTPAVAEDLLKGLRKCFHESVIDESKVDMFHEKVMAIEMPGAAEIAYQAASFALLAKKAWNPIEKIGHINRYAKLIAQAISAAPENIEIRFLRLSIDHNTPMVMGRHRNVRDDKTQILHLLKPIAKFEVDSHFNRFILYFLRTENIYSQEELEVVKAKLN